LADGNMQLHDADFNGQAGALLVVDGHAAALTSAQVVALHAALGELLLRHQQRRQRAVLAANLSLPFENA
jgi:hypothetical protein